MKPVAHNTWGAVLPLLIMLLLAMLTFWLDRAVDLTAPRFGGAPTHEPDYIVDKFNLKRLSATGEPRYLLTAERMVHFPDDDSSHLTQPRLVHAPSVGSGGNAETRVSAATGLVSSDGREVKLLGGVELFKAGDKSASGKPDDIRVRTEYLRVIPDDDKADTPERVVIEQGRSTLSGTGMTFDNRYRRIALQSSVSGTIERKK